MLCISKTYKPEIGPLIEVCVSEHKLEQRKLPNNKYIALIDTGASITCVSKKIVNELDLQSRGTFPITGTTGKGDYDFYFVNLLFFIDHKAFDRKDKNAPHSFKKLKVSSLDAEFNSPDFDLLIGRDIINKGYFSIFEGKFNFCL